MKKLLSALALALALILALGNVSLAETAQELTLLPESFVFADDNPAERAIVTDQLPGVLAPELEKVEHFARTIDHAGYFEVTTLSEDDKKRNEMYRENLQRTASISKFATYEEYLSSYTFIGVACHVMEERQVV